MAVTEETLHGDHVRAARALLRMSTRSLAEAIGPPVTPDALKSFENRPHAYMSIEGKRTLIAALERAGIKLYNSGREGASWSEPRSVRRSIEEARERLRQQ